MAEPGKERQFGHGTGASFDTRRTFVYDRAGRLTGKTAGSRTTSYAYDGFGRVVRYENDDASVALLYDPRDLVLGVVTSGVEGSAQPETEVAYTYDAAGEVVERYSYGAFAQPLSGSTAPGAA